MIKEKGIKIILIYNDFLNAIGSIQGRTAAANAIINAKNFGVPKKGGYLQILKNIIMRLLNGLKLGSIGCI